MARLWNYAYMARFISWQLVGRNLFWVQMHYASLRVKIGKFALWAFICVTYSMWYKLCINTNLKPPKKLVAGVGRSDGFWSVQILTNYNQSKTQKLKKKLFVIPRKISRKESTYARIIK